MEQQMMSMPAELLPLVQLFDAPLPCVPASSALLFLAPANSVLFGAPPTHAQHRYIPAMIDKAEPRGITCSFLSFSLLRLLLFFFFFFSFSFFFFFPNSLYSTQKW
jgi:hypothetical protein